MNDDDTTTHEKRQRLQSIFTPEGFDACTAAAQDWLLKAPSAAKQLNARGCAAISLVFHGEGNAADGNVGKVDGFIAELDQCVGKWFASNLRKSFHAEASNHKITLDDGSIVKIHHASGKESQAAEDAMRKEGKVFLSRLPVGEMQRVFDGILALFSPSASPTSRALLFDSKRYADVLTPFFQAEFPDATSLQIMALVAYTKDLVRFVRQGNQAMAQADLPSAWSMSGFGLWAHLNPEIGLFVNEFMRRVLWHEFGQDFIYTAPSHLIFKAEGGGSLASHHDMLNTRQLIASLRSFLNPASDTSDTSTANWACKHGFQALAHLNGGRDHGQTYIIGPMNPQRLLLCMEFLVRLAEDTSTDPERVKLKARAFDPEGKDGNTASKFLNNDTGPYFVRWERVLPDLNTHLKSLDPTSLPLSKMPIVPDACPNDPAFSGFVVMWPAGFPHGSFSNDSQRRVTVGINLRMRKHSAETVDPRVESWLRDLATVANPLSTPTQWHDAETRMCNLDFPIKGKTWHDGATHGSPQRAIKWVTAARNDRTEWLASNPGLPTKQKKFYESTHAPQNGIAGYFNGIAPRTEVVEAFLQGMNTAWMAQSALPPPSPHADPMVVPDPPSSPLDAVPGSNARPNLVKTFKPPKPKPTQWSSLTLDPVDQSASWSQLFAHDDVRILNVRQPWASALVFGLKTVENRSYELKTNVAPNFWMFIAASKNKISDTDLRDLDARAAEAGASPALVEAVKTHAKTSSGAIVGLCRFVGSWQKDAIADVSGGAFEPFRKSVWFNGFQNGTNDWAWCSADAVVLETPIEVEGKLQAVRLHGKPPDARDRILGALQTNALRRGTDGAPVPTARWDA